MKRYSSTELCPKCGGMMRRRAWTPVETVGKRPEGSYGTLTASCAECGFAAERAPHDATPRPTVVCLCGSRRFKESFERVTRERTLAGEIVLSMGSFEFNAETESRKAELDALHLHKVELADYVLVINVGGYVGDSTRREIAHARALAKRVAFLEPEPEPEAEA